MRRGSPRWRPFVVLAMLIGVAAASEAQTARTVRFASAAVGGQATFAILLPEGYERSETRYPVLYLLHGGSQTHTAYPARAWFAKEAVRRQMIVVMPHTPQFLYVARGGGPAPFDAFIPDLARYVDGNYRTVATRETRAIGGLSLGGYGAMMAGLRHPDLFATVGAFGGAFNDGRGNTVAAALAALPPGEAPFFYLACGIADQILDTNRRVAALLEQHRQRHEYREVPGGHTWDVWDPQTLAFFDVVSAQPGWRAR